MEFLLWIVFPHTLKSRDCKLLSQYKWTYNPFKSGHIVFKIEQWTIWWISAILPVIKKCLFQDVCSDLMCESKFCYLKVSGENLMSVQINFSSHEGKTNTELESSSEYSASQIRAGELMKLEVRKFLNTVWQSNYFSIKPMLVFIFGSMRTLLHIVKKKKINKILPTQRCPICFIVF